MKKNYDALLAGAAMETKLLCTSFASSSANFASVAGEAGMVILVPAVVVTMISPRHCLPAVAGRVRLPADVMDGDSDNVIAI